MSGQDSTALDFCATLTKGNHLIEMYGAEDCCDQETSWSFQVDDGEWLDFTTENLDTFYEFPQVVGDTVVWFGEMTAN